MTHQPPDIWSNLRPSITESESDSAVAAWQTRIHSGEPALGRPELVVRACERMEARGRLVASRNRYLLEQHGPEMIERVVQGLRPATARLLQDPPLAFSWVPLDQLVEIDVAILDKVMGGSLTGMRVFGEEIARYDMPLAFAMILRLGNPRFLIGKIDFVLKSYMRPMSMTTIEIGDRHALLRMGGIAVPQYFCNAGMPGWGRSALELTGAKNASVVHSKCRHRGHDECLYEVKWR